MSGHALRAGVVVRRPMVRYHGGKWVLAPWIISHFPTHRTYVEPFGGGASVLLRKARSYAEVYNDMDGEMVNLFRVARDRGDELARLIELTPFAREEFDLSYEVSEDPLEQARRTVVRSFQGFGGNLTRPTRTGRTERTGFRADTRRARSTPAHEWRYYPEALLAVVERLRGVVIEKRPASQVLATHDDESTLHYVDPPYPLSTRDLKPDYRHELTDQDHRQLVETLRTLRGHVVLSSYPSELYDELLRGWRKVECATFADGARRRVEVLWLSPSIERERSLF